jgi:DNA-binding NtrC family response regulator
MTMGDLMQSRVLLVDDDREEIEMLEHVLSGEGYACELAANAATAIRSVDDSSCDVVVSDVFMEGMDGLELLDRVKRGHPRLIFVLVTGRGGISQAVDAMKRGAFQYMTKPCDADALRQVVRDALRVGRESPSKIAVPSRRPTGDTGFDIVGLWPAMRALQDAIDFVA